MTSSTENPENNRDLLSGEIKSSERSAAIITLLLDSVWGMTAPKIAAALDISPGTARNHLRTLEHSGRVVRAENNRYKINTVNLSLIPNLQQLRPFIEPILGQLVDKVGYSLAVGTFNPDRTISVGIYVQHPSSPPLTDFCAIIANTAHCSGMGLPLSATLTTVDRMKYFTDMGMPRFTNKTVTDIHELDERLRKGRERAIYFEEGQCDPNIMSAGMVVRSGPLLESRIAIAAPFLLANKADAYEMAQSTLPFATGIIASFLGGLPGARHSSN